MLLASLATIVPNSGEEADREVVRKAAAKITLERELFWEKRQRFKRPQTRKEQSKRLSESKTAEKQNRKNDMPVNFGEVGEQDRMLDDFGKHSKTKEKPSTVSKARKVKQLVLQKS